MLSTGLRSCRRRRIKRPKNVETGEEKGGKMGTKLFDEKAERKKP
jgi:hypothetical protein